MLCGGFAAWLFQALPGVRTPDHTMLTFDIDLAVESRLSEHPGLEQLLTKADFHALVHAGTHPPVMKFQHQRWGVDVPAPICVEFLTPERGKKGGPVAATIQGGVTAQRLRFMDLALAGPVVVEASGHLDVPLGTVVRLPHPAMYVVHKALTAERRSDRAKKFKDLVYIYDVLVRTRPIWSEMAARIEQLRDSRERSRWVRTACSNLQRWFGTPLGVGVRAVTDLQAAQGRPVHPEFVQAASDVALRAIGLS